MPSASHHVRRLSCTATAIAVALLSSLSFASPAAAHGGLIATNPADGSTIAELPDVVSLEFSEAMQEGTAQIDVVAPSGTILSEGDAVVEGAIIRQEVSEPAEPGLYTVNWRAAGVDGHVPDGTFTFTVESASATEPSDPAAVPPADGEGETAQPSKKPVTTPAPTDLEQEETPVPADEDRGFGDILPWILLGASAAAIGGALIALLVSRTRRDPGSPTAGDGGSGTPSGR
ncbi:hypothetical protein ASD19_05880 [Microbacterium sp. Root53]|uniref:copper resistance CopC family protein n=1 Tax=Microbacterium sp. Root53 TaxID=1736553 RepID=UPI0006F43D4E|nr:copper resistance protein CopC [Microbacterium sp. Root53]KQY98747.1 hypothetical protein ASD19_05880 [Microbacterium sp. Root53]